MEKQWLLESFGTEGAHTHFVITHLPCRVGRSKDNDLVIANLGLSRAHAVLARDISGQIRLTDENSTNGTFVNRHRIEGYRLLNENDIIHFASAEFKLRVRLVNQRSALPFDEMHTMLMPEDTALSENFVSNEAEFDELIIGHGLSGAAQPIVDALTRQPVGYELLGRANHPLLPQSPIELFGLAEAMDRELELSTAFRNFGISRMTPHLTGHAVFINAHPKETFSETFLTSLETIHRASPELDIVVEIHESAVTDTMKLRELSRRLAQLDIRFAYDDFGAGQALARTGRCSGTFREIRHGTDSRPAQGQRTQTPTGQRSGANGFNHGFGAARRGRRARRRSEHLCRYGIPVDPGLPHRPADPCGFANTQIARMTHPVSGGFSGRMHHVKRRQRNRHAQSAAIPIRCTDSPLQTLDNTLRDGQAQTVAIGGVFRLAAKERFEN